MEQNEISNLLKLSERVSKVCKLFAEDNIMIRFSETATTASYAPAGNVLELPYNLKILSDEDISILFMSHEVGHAKWSSLDKILETNALGLHNEHNIVEDIRIERMIKRQYPGLVAAYVRGYSKLSDDGFFGSRKEWNIHSFANRLNIYAKVGPVTGKAIKFTETELDFYKRCMLAETEDQVIDLAKELATFKGTVSIIDRLTDLDDDELDEMFGEYVEQPAEEESEEEEDPEAPGYQNSDGATESPRAFADIDEAEREETLKRIAADLEKQSIQNEFMSKIDAMNLDGVSFLQYESANVTGMKILSAQDFVDSFKVNNDEMYDVSSTVKVLDDLKKSVDYMARQFEMRKAAHRIKHAKLANTGKINLDRVALYKVTDEIFGKKLIIKDAKKHGMVILIDASGSMSSQFSNVVRQTILLTEYAKKIGVPFKVYAFGGQVTGKYYRDLFNKQTQPNSYCNYSMSSSRLCSGIQSDIFEVLNSDLNKQDYICACHALINRYSFTLGGTPTAWAMGIAEAKITEFFTTHNVDIKKLFLITDGEPHDTHYQARKQVYVDKTSNTMIRQECNGPFFSIEVIGKIFKARYGIEMSTIFLTNKINSWDISSFVNPDTKQGEHFMNNLDHFKKHRYIKGEDAAGNGLFMLKPTNTESDINLDKIDSGTSVASAATAFRKAVSGMKVSQTMLQALSDEFAV